jgi:hypothetical protein
MELPKRRYDGLHNPVVLTEIEFKVLGKYMSCDIFKNIKILQRIGSDSLYATVWLASFNSLELETSLAIKIQKDIEKSESEAKISYKLEKWFDYFLLMYYHIRCDDIRLNGFSYSGMFMFMEVAISDLRQLIKYQNVTKAKLVSYILDVCNSIEIMATNFLYHGDLHIGNVFIVVREIDNKTIHKAVLGDFGETKYIVSVTSHLSDIRNFISSLSLEIKTTSLNTILSNNKLLTVLKHINVQTRKTEAEYDYFLERNEDPDLENEKHISLVLRDMGVIKDLIQGIF